MAALDSSGGDSDQVNTVVSRVVRVVENGSMVWQPDSKELLEMLRMLGKKC